jgi:transcriptional regulator with XRE-family HTH domain
MVPDHRFGYFLKTTRLARKMSGRELGRIAQIAPSTICDLEVGRRKPSPELVGKICRALGVEVGEIYTETGKMPENALDYIKNHPTAGILLSRLIDYKFSEKSLTLLVEHIDKLYDMAQDRKNKSSSVVNTQQAEIQDADDVFEDEESNDGNSGNVDNLDDDFA